MRPGLVRTSRDQTASGNAVVSTSCPPTARNKAGGVRVQNAPVMPPPGLNGVQDGRGSGRRIPEQRTAGGKATAGSRSPSYIPARHRDSPRNLAGYDQRRLPVIMTDTGTPQYLIILHPGMGHAVRPDQQLPADRDGVHAPFRQLPPEDSRSLSRSKQQAMPFTMTDPATTQEQTGGRQPGLLQMDLPHMPRTGFVTGSWCCALTGERCLRAHHAELVSLGISEDSPGFSAGLPDVDTARPGARGGGRSPDRGLRRCS